MHNKLNSLTAKLPKQNSTEVCGSMLKLAL